MLPWLWFYPEWDHNPSTSKSEASWHLRTSRSCAQVWKEWSEQSLKAKL